MGGKISFMMVINLLSLHLLKLSPEGSVPTSSRKGFIHPLLINKSIGFVVDDCNKIVKENVDDDGMTKRKKNIVMSGLAFTIKVCEKQQSCMDFLL